MICVFSLIDSRSKKILTLCKLNTKKYVCRLIDSRSNKSLCYKLNTKNIRLDTYKSSLLGKFQASFYI